MTLAADVLGDVRLADRPAASGATPAGGAGSAPAPRLRRDLNVFPADRERDGTAAWVLQDPAANRYFRLGAEEVDMLALVDGRSADSLAEATRRRFGHPVDSQDAEALFRFLRANNLVQSDDVQLAQFRRYRANKPGLFAKASKSYIFFRLPLLRPDRFLELALPYVGWLGARPTLIAIALLGALGLYLVTRQVDVFLATLVQFVSLEGLVAYSAVIVFVKIVHEFGHAFAAKARGLKVPTIGAAFIVFWPIAYTDTTDAWKLTSRRDRLIVGGAGVGVELAIAALSLFLWNVVPDGPIRSILFLLATSTWILSLLVNLNPLMRFDGYYLFSDLLRMPNLEPRGHAMGKWRLRRTLFGLDDPRPEPGRGWLAPYAYVVWVYRFFLFLGIALVVYYVFPKAIGIVLFAMEIVYFIAAPVWRELKVWVSRVPDFVRNPAFFRTLGVLILLGVLVAVPWRHSITAPAIVTGDYHIVYAPEAGRLIALPVRDGTRVEPGAMLATVAAPDLEQEYRRAVLRRDALLREHAALGVDSVRRERALVTVAELASQTRLIETLGARLRGLSVTADMAGEVVDMSDSLAEGAWVGRGEPLFALHGVAVGHRVVAYVGEDEVARIEPGAAARFIAEPGIWPSLSGRVASISRGGLARIDRALAMSSHGGGVDVRMNDTNEAVPLRAVYQVEVELDPAARGQSVPNELRGRVSLDAAPESLLSAMWSRTLALIYRESGF